MIHIVFEQANVEALSKAFDLDESLRGEIVEIKDDYAVGPIADIYETEGYQARRDWWKALLEFSPYKEQLDIVEKMQPLATSIEAQNLAMSELKEMVTKLSTAFEVSEKNKLTEEVVNASIDAKFKTVSTEIKKELAAEFSTLKTTVEANLKGTVSTEVVSEVVTGSKEPEKPEVKVLERKTTWGGGQTQFIPSKQK